MSVSLCRSGVIRIQQFAVGAFADLQAGDPNSASQCLPVALDPVHGRDLAAAGASAAAVLRQRPVLRNGWTSATAGWPGVRPAARSGSRSRGRSLP